MPRAPTESPIAISSASPTPHRPGSNRLGHQNRNRRSSSLLQTPSSTAGPSTRPSRPPSYGLRDTEDIDDLFAPGPSRPPPPPTFESRRRGPALPLAGRIVLTPTADEFRPRPQGLAIPSRSGSMAPGGPYRPSEMNGAGGSRIQAIDLTEDDDDVEVVAVNEAPRARRTGPTGPLWGDLHHINQVTAEREEAFHNLFGGEVADAQHRRPVPVAQGPPRSRDGVRFAPTPEELLARQEPLPPRPNVRGPGGDALAANGLPPRPRIGLGGAVIRRGQQQINYHADLPPRPRPPPGALRDPLEEDQMRRYRAFFRPGSPLLAMQPPEAPQQHHPPPRNRRREPRFGRYDAAAHAALDAEIDAGIRRDMANRDDGGFPPPFGLGMADIDLFERIRMVRQGLGIPRRAQMEQAVVEDPQAIIASVPLFEYPPPHDGFTSNFGIDNTIEIDQPASSKRFLACVYCVEPLMLQAGQKSPEDKVWALRCGHLLHQKCLEKLSSPRPEDTNQPPPDLPILGVDRVERIDIGVGTRGRTVKRPRAAKKPPPPPSEYEWGCPVKECGHRHWSVMKDAEWKQDEMEGALQMYT